MKITEKNAMFAVVRTACHGGGVVSYHKSLAAAERSERLHTIPGCTCGCCGVVPVTREAVAEMREAGYFGAYSLLEDLPLYTGSNEYGSLCK